MVPPLEVQTTEDPDLERAQSSIKKFVQPIEDCILLDGRHIEAVELLANDNKIEHKLNRQPRGWILCDVYDAVAAPLVYRTAWDDKTITLWASLKCYVSLWVF